MSVTFFTFASKIFLTTPEPNQEEKEPSITQKVMDFAKIFFLGFGAFLVGLAFLGVEKLIRAVSEANAKKTPTGSSSSDDGDWSIVGDAAAVVL